MPGRNPRRYRIFYRIGVYPMDYVIAELEIELEAREIEALEDSEPFDSDEIEGIEE